MDLITNNNTNLVYYQRVLLYNYTYFMTVTFNINILSAALFNVATVIALIARVTITTTITTITTISF